MINFFKKARKVEFAAPTTGKVIPLEQVKDDVFSSKMMGDGFAISPDLSDPVIVSPVAGKVMMIPDTLHAIGLKTANDRFEVLVHIGLDTVDLQGQGFKSLVQVGDHIAIGDPLIQVNWEQLVQSGYDVSTMVIVTNDTNTKFDLSAQTNQPVTQGTKLISIS